MKKINVRALCECSIMVAFASVLSLITLGSLPAGGSITLASMLPIVIISYRHGLGWGLASATVEAFIQMLLGLSSFSYFTTWHSILAVAILDFIVAFMVYGLSGIFRKKIKEQHTAMIYGAFSASLLRYLCHVISGATLWAGLSIPDNAALLYSLSYNATYMVPDTLILCIVTAYIATLIDFRAETPTRIKRAAISKADTALGISSGIVLLGAVIADIVLIFTRLQAESGEFDITLLGEVNWLAVAIVSVAACVVAAALLITLKLRLSKKEN